MANYRTVEDKKNRELLSSLMERLPDFCEKFFVGREIRLSTNSMKTYGYKYVYFFAYIVEHHPKFQGKTVKDIKLKDLDSISSYDIERFLYWLKEKNNTNKNSTLSAYIASLSSLWAYFHRRGMIDSNPLEIVDRERPKRKKVIYLKENEQDNFLNCVEYGSHLSNRQQKFHDINKERDYAIMTLFLHSGIRISELVGLNISDVNFLDHYIAVIRKGDEYDEVYISDEAEKCLQDYLEVRKKYHPEDDENALFLSKLGKRLSVRSIELMVKKYVTASLPDKTDQITPHKLRSTHAMDVLELTGNLRLVQERLGHKNIQTTTIYAEANMSDKAGIRNMVGKNTRHKHE